VTAVTAKDIQEAVSELSQTREADRERDVAREHRIREAETSEDSSKQHACDMGAVSGRTEPATASTRDTAVEEVTAVTAQDIREAVPALSQTREADLAREMEQAATTPAANTADDEQAVAKKTRRSLLLIERPRIDWDSWDAECQIDPASPPPPTDADRPAPLLASPQGQSTASAASASASAAQALPVSGASAETATVAVNIDDDTVLIDADIEEPEAEAAALELEAEAEAAAAERADRVPAVGSFRYESREDESPEGSGGFVRIVTSVQDQVLALAAVLAIRRRTMEEQGENVTKVARWSTQKMITKRVTEQWWREKPPAERDEVRNRVGDNHQAEQRTKAAYFRAAAKAHFGDTQWYYFTVAVGKLPGPTFTTLQTFRDASSRDTAEQSGGGSGSQARGPKTGIQHTVSECKAAREKAKLAMKHLEASVQPGAADWNSRRVKARQREVEDSSWHSTWGPRCRGADVNPCPPAVRAARARMPPHCHARPHTRAIAAQQVFDSPRRGGCLTSFACCRRI